MTKLPENVVIELSERYPMDNAEVLKARLIALKKRGFRVAIDDLGTGYSGLKLWSEIQPDFVKIDRHFVRDVDRDLVKKEFVRSVINLCERLGCRLIAEGVETVAELTLLRSMGIHLIQGFLLGRPNPFPAADLSALDGPAPLGGGQATSEEVFSSTFGRTLNEKKPVLSLMAHDALIVEHDESLEAVSQALLEDDIYYLKQHFIVTRNGQYMGLGSTRSLLRMMTRRRVEQAR